MENCGAYLKLLIDFWNAVEQKRAIPQIWHNEEHQYKIFYTISEK